MSRWLIENMLEGQEMADDYGFMQVDWEARIDFDRLRKDRVRKAQEAVAASEADILFVFRTEDARYLTS
jgi:Xaa-Pro aminopeptidase